MAYPDFTPDENYLISYLKTTSSSSRMSNTYMWGYVLSGSLMFGLGVFQALPTLMIIAFAVVVGFRLHEEWHNSKWTPKWRSIIEKYEAALKE